MQAAAARHLPAPQAAQHKTFVAFSMQVAQARVEEAVRQGHDFRTHQPELFSLGGITKPAAVILDAATGDWLLLGERDPQAAVLTLDDWVVALRARFIHPQQDPGVTIDPLPSVACQKAGKPAACPDTTRQAVRFFGGLDNTHFGQVCYEADWLLKKIGLALERVPVPDLKPYYTLAVEQARRARTPNTRVGSRFWFYPIVSHVNVLDDVVLLEQLQMGVFTEVLYAEVGGVPVGDVSAFDHYPSEGFARSLSDQYDAVAQAREVLETLRGLTRLAALAKGLTQVDASLPVAYYLRDYPVQQVETPQEVDVLRVQNREVGLEVAGGAHLMALVLRVQGGDTAALRDLVLQTRPTRQALHWAFEIEMQGEQIVNLRLPPGAAEPGMLGLKDLIPLWTQADFLYRKKRYTEAITLLGKLIELKADWDEPYNNRGMLYTETGQPALALADFGKALDLNPSLVPAYNNRGLVYARQGQYEHALAEFRKALALNPTYTEAYNNRGNVYALQGQYERALADYAQALALNPQDAGAYSNRGHAYMAQGQYERALAEFARALALNPRQVEVYNLRGDVYALQGQYERALADYTQALALNPREAHAYYNRGVAYMAQGQYERALADYTYALALNPQDAKAYVNRGVAYARQGQYERALADYTQALALNPQNANAYNNRGAVYTHQGQYERALADFRKAVALNPREAGAYFNQAVIYEKIGRLREAIEAYRSFIQYASPEEATRLQQARERIQILAR